MLGKGGIVREKQDLSNTHKSEAVPLMRTICLLLYGKKSTKEPFTVRVVITMLIDGMEMNAVRLFVDNTLKYRLLKK